MSPTRWFYDHDGQVSGPVSVSELRHLAASGGLLPTDHVRKEDMERWVKARAVKGLFAPAAAEAATAPATEPTEGDTVFDFFGTGPPPAPEAEPEEEPLNPAFDFFGTTSFSASRAPAEVELHSPAPPLTRKPTPPRKSKIVPPPASPAPEPSPADSGSFSFTAPAAVEETPVAFTADVPMATPVLDEEVPFAAPASGVGLALPPLQLAGDEVVLQPDGTAAVTGVTLELSVSGGWLTARGGGQETHLRLGRLDAVTLRERLGAGLVLSLHAGGQTVAVRCDGDAEPARAFVRRLLDAAG
jgi:hypothetical protein